MKKKPGFCEARVARRQDKTSMGGLIHVGDSKSRASWRTPTQARSGTLSRALTLVEVLISMFVLAIGLLGVLALLPLGQTQVQRGVIDQRATELAEEAFASIETYGITNPTRWLASGWNPTDPLTPNNLNQLFDAAANGTRIAFLVGPSPTAGQFTAASNTPTPSVLDDFYKDCVVEFVRGDLAGQRRRVSTFVGATREFRFSGTLVNGQDSSFGNPPTEGDVFIVIRNQAFAIDPTYVAIHGASSYRDFAFRVPRVTLAAQRVTGGAVVVGRMTYDMADAIFVADDDLVFEKPDDAHAPPQQLYVLDNNGAGPNPIRRKSNGNFSWLATIVPAEGDIDTRNHTVSVVVFYQRPVRLGPLAQSNVEVRFADGPNYGGGMAKLSATQPGVIFDDVDNNGEFMRGVDKNLIKSQQWIFVKTVALQAQVSAARWYRIASVGEPFTKDVSGTLTYRVDVQLAGPDWDTALLKRQAAGTIHQGVVGVFERSMEIEPLTVGKTQ